MYLDPQLFEEFHSQEYLWYGTKSAPRCKFHSDCIISTSKSEEIAKSFAGCGGEVFKIFKGEFEDLRVADFSWFPFHPYEQEVFIEKMEKALPIQKDYGTCTRRPCITFFDIHPSIAAYVGNEKKLIFLIFLVFCDILGNVSTKVRILMKRMKVSNGT